MKYPDLKNEETLYKIMESALLSEDVQIFTDLDNYETLFEFLSDQLFKSEPTSEHLLYVHFMVREYFTNKYSFLQEKDLHELALDTMKAAHYIFHDIEKDANGSLLH